MMGPEPVGVNFSTHTPPDRLHVVFESVPEPLPPGKVAIDQVTEPVAGLEPVLVTVALQTSGLPTTGVDDVHVTVNGTAGLVAVAVDAYIGGAVCVSFNVSMSWAPQNPVLKTLINDTQSLLDGIWLLLV